jgi:predicted dehydrogenase
MKIIATNISTTSPKAFMNPSSTFATKTRRKLKFAIVGAGAVAQSYLRAFEGCDEGEVAAIVDCRAEVAKQLAERLGCPSYDRVERMTQACEIDAAIVCTPPVTHPEICIYLAQNKLHVLCEKPFSIDERSARRMVDTARGAGVKLTMASKFRYVDDIVLAKSMISAGILGDLILFENVFATRVDMASRWNSRPEISGGGVLIDNGTHSADLMRYFLGPLAEVHVLEGKRSQELAVEDTVALSAHSVSGVICTIHLSWSISTHRDSYLDIYGSRGAISVGWKQSKYLAFSNGRWIEFGKGYDKIQAFRSQIENFSRAIRGEEFLLITGEDAIASVRVIESAYEALRQKQWTPVPLPLLMPTGLKTAR